MTGMRRRLWLRALTSALVLVGVLGACTGRGSDQVSLGVAGYVVPWDARSQPTAGSGILAEASPVWYQPTEDGGVVFVSDQAQASVTPVRAKAAERGVSLMPSVSNFVNGRWAGELIDRLVADPKLRSTHVTAIVELVRMRHWAGVDIDYESLAASSRADYSEFIHQLAAALHQIPARLSVTVHAKTAEPGTWSGAQAQDWQAIGTAADEVRVMAYDYSTADSPPGPIAPPSWVDQVLTLATNQIPPDRIVVGLPTYGYDWTAGVAASSLQWTDVQAIVAARAVASQWDASQSSPWLRYTDDQGREHTIWYEDARSLAAKLEVAKRHGVTEVVLWRLGGEDPGIWPQLRPDR